MHDDTDSLNDDEQQRLREIEAELERDDPELAAVLATSPLRRSIPRLTRRFGRRLGRRLGLSAGALGGTVMLAVGLVLPAPVVGIGGFALLVVVLSRMLDAEAEVLATRVLSMLGSTDVPRPDSGPSDAGEPGPERTS